MNVVALFRVSTERQANENSSLDAQQRTYRELAARSGWTTIGEFRGCESATQAATDRQVLQQVLASLRLHSPDAIYVHEQSRLTRGDELEVAVLLRELRERRVKIIVSGVVRDLASVDERFMVGIQSLVDRAEAERIRERVNRGKRERALQGRKNCGPAAFGYRNPHVGDPKRGVLQVVPEEAAIVQRIFELAAAGAGPLRISLRLAELGIPAPKGGAWGETSVRRILNNPVYIGVHVSGGWAAPKGTRSYAFDANRLGAIVVPDSHEPIVAREVWDRVHARPQLPRTRSPHLLTGLLWVNQSRCTGNVSSRKPFYARYDRAPGHPWLRVGETDAAVWKAFVQLATSPQWVRPLIVQAGGQRPQDEVRSSIARHEANLRRQRERFDRLLDMRADGEIDKATYAAKKAEVQLAIEQDEKALHELRASLLADDGTQAERVVKAVQTLLAGQMKLDVSQRRSILHSVVRRIDATASREEGQRPRLARGRYAPGRAAHWKLRELRFHLDVPELDQSGCFGTTCSSRAARPS